MTQPAGSRHVIVVVETSEAGLTGLGCATFTQRPEAVRAALDHYLGPFCIGKDPRNIEDLWQSMMVNGYWRNGPVLNNAISGIDMALWDIKGKLAGMPCYQLWGGACRPAAMVYTHCGGDTPEAVVEDARAALESGYRAVRCQLGGYTGTRRADSRIDGTPDGAYFDQVEKRTRIPKLFETLRTELGDEPELLYDIHERLAPIDAIGLAKELEPYRLFFLEDPFAPEDLDWLRMLRGQCATPIAIGELFNHPRELTPLIAERLLDYVRVHLSQIGGITPAWTLIHLCDAFGVRTAWHGPGDTSPVGMAAGVHLDVTARNFGIQEWANRSELELEVFPGTPELRDGFVWPNDRPGLGIDIDEQLAAGHPHEPGNPSWTESRLFDGTIWRP